MVRKICLWGGLLLLWCPLSHAQLEIEITQGNIDPLRIAVPAFKYTDEAYASIASGMVQIMTENLSNSGLFLPMDPRSFPKRTPSMGRAPRFADWEHLDADFLLIGEITQGEPGQIRAAYRLWDLLTRQERINAEYEVPLEGWRRLAHMISDDVYTRFTGEDGYFDTQIAFIAVTGPKTDRTRRLAVMDQDGGTLRYLTDGKDLVLTPRFSPVTESIIYMSYKDDTPRVYIMDIETQSQTLVGNFPDMTFAPRFSPDGRRVVMSLSQEGDSHIYTMDLISRKVTALTTEPGINTAPSYSPDGRYITFESDRSGTQQIYVMRADGSGVRRISHGVGRYGTPVWSPRGDLIAFTKLASNLFLIGVMTPQGEEERILTSGYHKEGPTWSSNGRRLLFFKDSPDPEGGPEIWSVDLSGYNELRIATPTFASSPSWSPPRERPPSLRRRLQAPPLPP